MVYEKDESTKVREYDWTSHPFCIRVMSYQYMCMRVQAISLVKVIYQSRDLY